VLRPISVNKFSALKITIDFSRRCLNVIVRAINSCLILSTNVCVWYDLYLNFFFFSRYNKMDLKVSKLFVYPIKSCGAFETNEWMLEPSGFSYDRNWAVVSDTGVCITQMLEPKLCLVRPYIDLQKRTMTLIYAGKRCCNNSSTYQSVFHNSIEWWLNTEKKKENEKKIYLFIYFEGNKRVKKIEHAFILLSNFTAIHIFAHDVLERRKHISIEINNNCVDL